MFWALSLLTTVGGGVASDYLLLGSRVVGGAVEAGLLVAGLGWQLRTRRYTAPAFWFLAYAIAIFTTGVSDTVHRAGLPYGGATLLWAVLLAAVLAAWYRADLSTSAVVTRRAEALYWAMAAATVAFGTALADFTASGLNLGYLPAVAVFAAASAVPVADWGLGLRAVTTFWLAYVLLRPLGAAAADYLSQARSASGLGFGDAGPALLATLAVGFLAIRSAKSNN